MNALSALTIDANGLEKSLRLLDLPPAWVIVLVVLPLFALVTWIGYAREAIGTTARVSLSSLRIAAFLLLGLVLSRPVMVERREEVHPAEVLVLLDDSASMQRQDAYADPKTRAAVAKRSGRAPESSTRLDLAKGALATELMPLFRDGEYEVRTFAFSEALRQIEDADAASGRGAGTHLGDAVIQAVVGNRGRPVTDVLVLSDGRSNGGVAVLEAARAAGAAGIPVHTVLIGDTRPEKNAIVELIESPTDALEDDEVAVTVRVLARGAEGRVRVLLEELSPDGSPERLLADEEIELSEDGERVVLVAPSSSRTGERRFRVAIPPVEGETMLDDNQVEFRVQISPARVRVLFVDGYPRWEYRYLKNMLLRADKKLVVQCYLLSATRDFPQESSESLPSLREVPTTRTELLENYDVVVLGDVNPNKISSDPAKCEAFMIALREFVEAGGGVCFQAGEYDDPRAYRQTPLEDLLPIVLDASGVLTFEGDTSTEFRPVLEEPNQPHEILRLHPDLEVNQRLWEDPDGLRGFYWYQPVRRAKPGTEVLLRHPVDANPQTGEPYPLLVLGHFPAGRTMFLAVDSTWMWRYHYGDRYHETFWRNAIRWLALGRLKSGAGRFRLEASRAAYDLEERVALEARVLDQDFRPSDAPEQLVLWSGPEGDVRELVLAPAADRPGIYRGSLQVDRPGLYTAWIEAGGARMSGTEFEVLLPSRENADPTPDPDAMALLASRTGGRAVPLASVGDLADEFPGGEERREPISSSLEDVWDRWTTLIVALGLLGLEWILRKRVELV